MAKTVAILLGEKRRSFERQRPSIPTKCYRAIVGAKRQSIAKTLFLLAGCALAGHSAAGEERVPGHAATVATNPSYAYPGDVPGANFTTAWALFAFTRAQANGGPTRTAIVDVKGSTDGRSCTIFLLGNGTPGVDLTTTGAGGIGRQCSGGARAFCSVANNSCQVLNVYDATDGDQNCNIVIGTLLLALDQPSTGMIAVDSGVQNGERNWCLASKRFTPATGQASLSFFGERTSSGGYAVSIAEADGGNTIEMGGGPGQWRLDIGSGPGIPARAPDNVWHAATGIIDRANSGSVINIDGTETSGGPIRGYPYKATQRPFGFTNNNSAAFGGKHTYGTFSGFSDNNLWPQVTRQQICHALYQIEGQITPDTHC